MVERRKMDFSSISYGTTSINVKTSQNKQNSKSEQENGEKNAANSSSQTKDYIDLSTSGAFQLNSTQKTGGKFSLADANSPPKSVGQIDAVFSRIEALAAENGVSLSPDQKYKLALDAKTGEVSISGIDDPELQSAMQELVANDKELASLMQSARIGEGKSSSRYTLEHDPAKDAQMPTTMTYDQFKNSVAATETASTQTPLVQNTQTSDAQQDMVRQLYML